MKASLATQTDCQRLQRDMSERNARLEHYLIETNHRMKNNLQMITALLEMQTDEARTLSAEGVARLQDYVQTLGALQDLLTPDADRRDAQDRISARAVLDRLIPLMRNFPALTGIRYQAQEVMVPARKAMTLAVIAQELISNALKHGNGSIEVALSERYGRAVLEVGNDGPGFPLDFTAKKAARTGLALIEQLAEWDLDGTIGYANRIANGVRVIVEFPVPPARDAIRFDKARTSTA